MKNISEYDRNIVGPPGLCIACKSRDNAAPGFRMFKIRTGYNKKHDPLNTHVAIPISNYTYADDNELRWCVFDDIINNGYVLTQSGARVYFDPETHFYYTDRAASNNVSFGEQKIAQYLNNNNIIFEAQKHFDWCKRDKYYLYFDFYLPQYNLCIEYNGRQHYAPINYMGGQKIFEDQQIRDNIKRKACETNSMRLLEIAYTDYDNIDSILSETLEKICVEN